MHLAKLIQVKEEWIVSPVKRVEVLLVLFQQLAYFHNWFFPLVVWKPRAELWAYSTAQTKKQSVSANQIFPFTTWTDIFLTACGSGIESLPPVPKTWFMKPWKLPTWSVLQFSTFQQFQFSSHMFASGKTLSQWTTALFTTYPESCPVVMNMHDRLIWKIICNPAEVFGFFFF